MNSLSELYSTLVFLMEPLCPPYSFVTCSLQALIIGHVKVRKVVGMLVGKNIKELGLLAAF